VKPGWEPWYQIEEQAGRPLKVRVIWWPVQFRFCCFSTSWYGASLAEVGICVADAKGFLSALKAAGFTVDDHIGLGAMSPTKLLLVTYWPALVVALILFIAFCILLRG
jgi:hypothetical protein